ncbi:hypothetical protein BHYA_0038g00120 [Botrytis hyacinthi]|uniref:Uncharacterized protein n=1 Tax=Botrytis hyacinthi TaxID=278943 RepID=A0A4Z1GV68_9HELO|nr:hypothetical protein BHYA_0038g00120 [Botrytis hyacinthi]
MAGLFTGNVLSPCKELCQLAMYGLMSKRLSECNLWPLPKAENYHWTPFQLHKTIARALNLSYLAHKPMGKIHTGNCYFADNWNLALQRKLTSGLCEYDVPRGESETEGNKFQQCMDDAVEEVGDFDCPNEIFLEGYQGNPVMEILELCPMKSSR